MKVVSATGETRYFVYGASSKLVAEYSTVGSPTAQTSYLTTDHLGSPRVITDQSGTVTSRRDFHPFGEEVFTVQRTQGLGYTADTIRQKFTGYERDIESELDFAQARYYFQNQGRFMSVDLIAGVRTNPQSLNRYSYVMNQPLRFNDPSGHLPESPNEKIKDYSKNNPWYEPSQDFVPVFKEWVNNNGRPLWVPPDEYAAGQTERSKFPLWTELTYQSSEGQVTLDPRGPNPETPWGWTLDRTPVGSGESGPEPPTAPGQLQASETAMELPGIVSHTNDIFHLLRFFEIYNYSRNLRSRGQALFPDSVGRDAQRHRWATRQLALQYGTGTARTFGVLNEGQGFIMHDLFALPSTFEGRRTWAFQFSDLQNNELGIDDASSIIKNQRNIVPK